MDLLPAPSNTLLPVLEGGSVTSVSVIVPTYNGAQYLRETLSAISAQTRPANEVLVVDDHSTDNSAQIAQAHSAVTRLILSDENNGVCAARNKGLDVSTGDLIAFCDQDDLWSATKLEMQVRAMEMHPEIDYTFTNFVHLRGGVVEQKEKFSEARKGWWQDASSPAGVGLRLFRRPALPSFLDFQPAFPSTMMVRRSLIERAGKFDESLGRERSEDLEFLLRCESVGTLAAIQLPLVTIRKHDLNYSADNLKTTISQIRILQAMIKSGSRYEQHRRIIKREIARRSSNVIDGAFAVGDMSTCVQFAREFWFIRRPPRQQVKIAIASLPSVVGRPLAAILAR